MPSSRAALTIYVVVLAVVVLGQQRDLTLGLNTFYSPNGTVGLGATVDYRWHRSERTEWIGLLSQTLFFDLGQDQDRAGSVEPKGSVWNSGVQAGGIGFGYRCGTEGRGFHIGLLAGGVRYREVVLIENTYWQLSPALGLTMGHRIGQRMAISMDWWVAETTKDQIAAFPLLRFNYSLWRKN